MIDYLALGHVAKDVTMDGYRLGGSVSYAGRTALAFGFNVGVVTSCSEDLDLSALRGIQVCRIASQHTTTFENTSQNQRRSQKIRGRASHLDYRSIPESMRPAKIVHLAPILDEVDPGLLDQFPSAFKGITPQGWLRTLDADNTVRLESWETIKSLLPRADAVVLSNEDLRFDARAEASMAKHCRVLVVTKASDGATIYFDDRREDLLAIKEDEVDSTGAGDIFASAFFICYYQTDDPIQAGTYANRVAAGSITRKGIESTPTYNEILEAGIKVQ